MKNRPRLMGVAALALALAGCAAGDGGTTALIQMSGNARVALDRTNPNALTVVLLNVRDLGYDFNDATAREAFIARMLTEQCGAPSIVETKVTKTGGTSLREFQVFTIEVSCPNGASQIVR